MFILYGNIFSKLYLNKLKLGTCDNGMSYLSRNLNNIACSDESFFLVHYDSSGAARDDPEFTSSFVAVILHSVTFIKDYEDRKIILLLMKYRITSPVLLDCLGLRVL